MFFFFFNDTATTEIYTLSLHDALPICHRKARRRAARQRSARRRSRAGRARQGAFRNDGAVRPDEGSWQDASARGDDRCRRSEEHTSELQSRQYLVCRLLLEKKNNIKLT